MTKITSLTKKQESLVPVYLKKWLDVGYRTKTVDRKKARKAVDFLYVDILKINKPKHYLFLDSPMACQMALNIIGNNKSQLGSQLGSQLVSQLHNHLRSQLRSQLGSQLGSQLDSQLHNQLVSQLDSQLHNQLYSQLGSQLRSQLGSQLRSQLGSQLDSQLHNQLVSQLDSQLHNQLVSQLDSQLYSKRVYETRSNWWNNYYWHFDFILNEIFPEKKKEFTLFSKYLKGSKEYHQLYLSPDFAIICDFPEEINLNQENRLHKDGSLALKYRDGYGIYSLNGIIVPKEIAEVKPRDITKDMILKLENADHRRELVRKLPGAELVKVLDPKIIDSQFGYDLLGIELGDGRTRPFLKMQNPSIDAVHVEGVLPSCLTVKNAIDFRNGVNNGELPLTLDGFELFVDNLGDYFQQGDLLLKIAEIPEGAVKAKDMVAGEGLIRHMLTNGEMFDKNGKRYILPLQNCRIVHPEHKDVILPEGLTVVISKTLEYDHFKEESREVID